MKIAFLGTPAFSVPSLAALLGLGHETALFTQPDRPVGRHGAPVMPPAKEYALSRGVPVYQFEKIRSPEGLAALRAFAPELMVTAAFGQLLSAENLAVPKYGCINVHGSLLPKYRGAAPIQWAVIDGETETGVTTMQTDIGMDTGDMLLTARTPIGPEETAGELSERLSHLGAALLGETIAALQSGALVSVPQNEAEATKCPMLKKEHGKIDFSKTALSAHNLVRGVNPWPGAYASLCGETIKLWKTRVLDAAENAALRDECGDAARPGLCMGDGKRGLFLLCGEGALEALELQAPGGKRLDGKSFLRGKPIAGGQLT